MIGFIAPTVQRKAVEKKLRKVAHRARVDWIRVEGTSIIVHQRGAEKVVIECDRYELGDICAHEGHMLLARVEHTEAGNIVCVAPGPGRDIPLASGYAHALPTCDHCGKNRKRRDTLLMLVDGKIKQIGRTCVKKYFPVDPDVVLAQVELISWIDEISHKDYTDVCSGSGCAYVPTLDFVACVVASCEEHGFHKTESVCPTRYDAYERFIGRKTGPTQQHFEEASRLLEWAQNMDAVIDYHRNLKVAANLSDVRRNSGVLASIKVAYDRVHRIEKRAEEVDAGHYGTVGQRAEIEVTLAGRRSIETFYGNKVLYEFKTDAGHKLAWFCTGKRLFNHEGKTLEVGDTLEIKASIKEHNVYKNRCQTLLTRCKTL